VFLKRATSALIRRQAFDTWNNPIKTPKRRNGDGDPDPNGPIHLTAFAVEGPNKVVTRIFGFDERRWPDVDFVLTITDTLSAEGGEVRSDGYIPRGGGISSRDPAYTAYDLIASTSCKLIDSGTIRSSAPQRKVARCQLRLARKHRYWSWTTTSQGGALHNPSIRAPRRRPVDDGRLRRCRERGRNPVLKSGHPRCWRSEECRGTGHQNPTSVVTFQTRRPN
jgi:hypothetical protein